MMSCKTCNNVGYMETMGEGKPNVLKGFTLQRRMLFGGDHRIAAKCHKCNGTNDLKEMSARYVKDVERGNARRAQLRFRVDPALLGV